MKEKILTIMFSLFCLTAAGQNNQNTTLLGDANGDGKVDVADIVEVVNYIDYNPSALFNFGNADINNDNNIDISDIEGIKGIIMSSSIDSDLGIYHIEPMNTYGWDEGYIILNIQSPVFILSKTINNSTWIYINNYKELNSYKKGFVFLFEQNVIKEIYHDDIYYYTKDNGGYDNLEGVDCVFRR